MHFKFCFALLPLIFLVLSKEPEIIDFTYTQLLEEASYTGDYKDKITIHPDTQQLEKYEFPEVCNLQEDLKLGSDNSGTEDKLINIDDYVEKLGDKILHLLKLAEKIKNSRNYLACTSTSMKKLTSIWNSVRRSRWRINLKSNCSHQ